MFILTALQCIPMRSRREFLFPVFRKDWFEIRSQLTTLMKVILFKSSTMGMNISVVVETVSETSHLCWNNVTIRFKSSLTSIIIESTYLTLKMNKIWGCFKVQVGWKNAFYGETGSRKGLEKVSARPWPLKKHFLTFKCQQNNHLSVFNVQIIRLYSLGSWNFYVPDNFKI